MLGERLTLFASGALALTSAASASIERVKGLQCTGTGMSLTILLDHDGGFATVAAATGAYSTYRVEQDDAFLTWRLVDGEGRKGYVLREGDKVNGDLGWYIVSLLPSPDGKTEPLMGTCSPID
jgi:hypothetical protein